MSVDYTASWTQICNRALGRLGSDTIDDLDEGTMLAEYCGRFLPEAVEHVLGQWDFKFARRRMTLAPTEEDPKFGWARQFNLPKDLIRLISVYEGTNVIYDKEMQTPFQVENGLILANSDSLHVIYIARPDEPNQLPQTVRKAVSTHLAYLLSTAITSNEQLTALTLQEAQAAIEEAKKRDAQMNYDPDSIGQDFHTEVRK